MPGQNQTPDAPKPSKGEVTGKIEGGVQPPSGQQGEGNGLFQRLGKVGLIKRIGDALKRGGEKPGDLASTLAHPEPAKTERPANPETESAKEKAREVMTSRFGLLPEDVNLDEPPLTDVPRPREYADDGMFRQNVTNIMPQILAGEGRVLILQSIGTAHAVTTSPVYLENGMDMYYAFPPNNQAANERQHYTSGYHSHIGTREIPVALANEDRIQTAKSRLTQQGLRGVVLQFDPHAMAEDNEGDFDRFFPTPERLRELGITRIVYVGEFQPQNAGNVAKSIAGEGHTQEGHSRQYMRRMQQEGFPLTVFGVDTRPSRDTGGRIEPRIRERKLRPRE